MSDIGPLLLTGLGLLSLWLVAYFGWRPYRIDKVRNELFDLRNDLFLYAAEGGVVFDDPAYRIQRDRLNALIRFAHIITVTRALIFMAAERYRPNERVQSIQQKYLVAVSNLSESAQVKMRYIYDRTATILAWQLVSGSPLLLIAAAIYLPLVAASKFLRRTPKESTGLIVARELRVELIEEQAMLAQTQQIDLEACELAHP